MVRFIHITDTHIAADPNFELYGHRPLDNLRQLVTTINELPYPFDFVLHTGDVVDDLSVEAYEQSRQVLNGLRAPIHYVTGNHDHTRELQRMLAGIDDPRDRYDYAFESGGVQFVVLESNGPIAPGGEIQPRQLEWLGQYVTSDGPPLVIALHHPPIPLGVPWLDEIITMSSSMLIANSEQFLGVIQPAKARLRGVFFGHVHRSFQVWQDGILFSSAPSASAQLKTWPDLRKPSPAPEEAPGYCLVTIDEHKTIVQQYTFAHAG